MTTKDAVKAAEAIVDNNQKDITISLADFAKARKVLAAETSWKWKILTFLKNNQGATDLEIYQATRGSVEDEPKVKKSLASQYTYLRDEGCLILKEEGKVFVVTEPHKGKIRVIPGMEGKAKAAGLIS